MNVEAEERTEIASALRASIQQSGLTQAEFARSVGTSSARMSTYLSGKTVPSAAIYLRAVRWGRSLQAAQQQGLLTPDVTADATNRALADGDEDFSIRLILQSRDDLRVAAIDPIDIRSAWRHRAHAINDPRFDTLFRAIIAHEFGDDAPTWSMGARLTKDWVADDPFRSEEIVREQTPSWLASARIYIAERGLATA